jgi:hypothetical protein
MFPLVLLEFEDATRGSYIGALEPFRQNFQPSLPPTGKPAPPCHQRRRIRNSFGSKTTSFCGSDTSLESPYLLLIRSNHLESLDPSHHRHLILKSHVQTRHSRIKSDKPLPSTTRFELPSLELLSSPPYHHSRRDHLAEGRDFVLAHRGNSLKIPGSRARHRETWVI